MVVCKAEVAAIFADQAGLAKTVDSRRYSVRLCFAAGDRVRSDKVGEGSAEIRVDLA